MHRRHAAHAGYRLHAAHRQLPRRLELLVRPRRGPAVYEPASVDAHRHGSQRVCVHAVLLCARARPPEGVELDPAPGGHLRDHDLDDHGHHRVWGRVLR